MQVRDGMRFVEVVLNEPDKNVVALADAYFFPPYQPTLYRPKAKGGAIYPLQLPPRQARLVVYNKRTNETSIWMVELSEVHATARGGHHRGKVLSSVVVPDVQPPMVKPHMTKVLNLCEDFCGRFKGLCKGVLFLNWLRVETRMPWSMRNVRL